MDAIKENLKTKLRDQNKILDKCIKEKRDMYRGEKKRFDALESEIVDMEKQLDEGQPQEKPESKSLVKMEEVPLSGVDKDMVDQVNEMIAFCQQDLGLTGIQVHYYREYWDGNPRQYSGLAFSHDGSSKGFVYPNKYDNDVWINSEVSGYFEDVQKVVAHECKHLKQGKQTDESDAVAYSYVAVVALRTHYSSVKECCARNNIAYN